MCRSAHAGDGGRNWADFDAAVVAPSSKARPVVCRARGSTCAGFSCLIIFLDKYLSEV